MQFKTWILDRMNGWFGRPDLPPRSDWPLDDDLHSTVRSPAKTLQDDAALGPYAPLIASIRDELDQFVASDLRLHLAIAERDQYLLTSIEIDAGSNDEAREQVQRFVREFKPEQIKRYLVHDVISALPNADAIDLSQFAGLRVALPESGKVPDAGPYGELLAQLRDTGTDADDTRYRVRLVGRWTERGLARANDFAAGSRSTAAPAAPLAGVSTRFDLEDADGTRRVSLKVVPNQRYSFGKEERCDVRVNGTYASRRHCEVWNDGRTWWVTDAGSTNGIRVESGVKLLGRSGATAAGSGDAPAIELVANATIVLSAFADGTASDYPRIALVGVPAGATAPTPIAPRPSSPRTPITPIVARAGRSDALTLTVSTVAGTRSLELDIAMLPLGIGRSRGQAVVVDWAHEGVSGHHADIEAVDDAGARVRVHGDNGVTVDGRVISQGAAFHWKVGESMILGSPVDGEPSCTLTLARKP